jgi:hypothetical protein
VASLSMDKDYSAAKMPVDTDQLIDVATERLLAG